jgi:benzoylformate decarboxylase
MKNRITGRSAFLALLKDEGITHLFGNPGTTELPIMHALKDHPDLTYVMAMQESLVVAIADGFSRASAALLPATSMLRRAWATRWARSTMRNSRERR